MTIFHEVGHCIWRSVGGIQRGKQVTILGGVHGNELTGIQVIELLKENCPPLVCGQLTLVLGNPKAIEKNTRGSIPHADLNRHFTMDVYNSTSIEFPYEVARAKEIASYLKRSDLVLDLHATNKPSRPFLKLAGLLTPQHHSICKWFPCKTILHDPNYLLAGKIALTDEYTGAHGGIGIIYESGHATDTSQVHELYQSVLNILVHEMKLIDPSHIETQINPQPQDTIFEITEVFRLPSSGFQWKNGHGEENFQHVRANKTIGEFGDGSLLHVPYDSYIVFPKVPSLWKVDSPLGWLAKLQSK